MIEPIDKNKLCYFTVKEQEKSSAGNVCATRREDYFECLHHRKEHEMVRRVHEQKELNDKVAVGGHGGGH